MVDAIRAEANSGRRVGGDGRRRGHERVRPVVQVEQRPLPALEQDVPPVAERTVDDQRGVAHVRAQALRIALVARGDFLEVERLDLVHALEPDVLLGERDLDLLAQDLRAEHILHTDSDP